MPDYPAIVLRYFDVRGRAQFIRGLLGHRQVPFTDERVHLSADLSSWRTRDRENRDISGSFQKLPTLQWGDLMVGEVLVIMDFLHRKLGDAEALGERDSQRHSMLISSAFLDLLTPCINLVWSDIFNPGADLARTTSFVRARLETHLATVDRTLTEWRWLDDLQDRPVMGADAVLWEALDVIRETFDGGVSLESHGTLADFYLACPGSGTFRALIEVNPATITARPGEAEALEVIRAS